MSITIGDVLLKMGIDSKSLDAGLSSTQNQVKKWVEDNQKSLRDMGIAFTAMGASITASLGLAVKASVNVESTRGAFENLAKSNQQSAKDILDALKKASAGAVAENELMLSANRAMVLGVAQNTNQFSDLMEIARDRARTMGLTTTQAFDNIVTGIGRGSPLILDNLGIIVDLETAHKEYAKGLGKTAESLTEAEKQQALLNAVLKQGQAGIDKSAQSTMTASESMQSLKASIGDVTAGIGQSLLPIVQTVSKITSDLISGYQSWSKENKALSDSIVIIVAGLGITATVIGATSLALSTSTGLWISNTAAIGARTVASIAAIAVENGLRVAMQATWAVMAANPIGPVIAGIGLLTVGIMELVSWQNRTKASQDALNKSTQSYEPPVDTAIAKTEAWKNALIELNKVQGKASASEKQLNEIREAIYNRFKIYIDALTDDTLANDASIKSTVAYSTAVKDADNNNRKYIDGLQEKTRLTQYDINYLEAYYYTLNKTNQAEKQRESNLRATVDWQSKIQGLATDQEAAATKAAKLSVSLDDVAGYLIAVGRAADLAAIPTGKLVDVTKNAQSLSEYFSLDPSVIYQWKLETEAIQTAAQKAEEAFKQQKSDAEAVAQAIEDMHKNIVDLGDSYAYSQTTAGKLGVTTDIMTGFLLDNGRTVEEIIAIYDQWGTDANVVAEKVGVALGEVARWSELTKEKMLGDISELTESAKQAARDAVDAQQDAIDETTRLEEKAHQKRLDNIQDEYDAEMESIDRTLAAKIDKYNTEMGLIDQQISDLDKARKDRENASEKSKLESEIGTETDSARKLELNRELDQLILESGNEAWQEERRLALEKQRDEAVYAGDKAAAEKELNDYLYELEYNRQKSELETQKDTLRDKITAAQEAAEEEKETARANYEYWKGIEDQKWERFQQSQTDKKTKLDQELTETLKRYDDDLKKFQNLCANKLAETDTLVTEYNKLVDQMNRDVTITIHKVTVTSPDSSSGDTSTGEAGSNDKFWVDPGGGVHMMAKGGVVKARPGGQLIVAGEAGEDEIVTPVSKLREFFNNFMSGFSLPGDMVPAPLISNAGALSKSINNYNSNQGGDTYININLGNVHVKDETDANALVQKIGPALTSYLRLKGVRG